MNQSSYQLNSLLPGAIRRKALSLSQSEMVQQGSLSGCGSFPLLIEPKIKGLRLTVWAEGQQALIAKQLQEQGAILFRGFMVDGVGDFERCVEVISNGALEYRFRASPRSQVGKNIYTSTDYPPNQSIFPHNEHAYSPIFPLQLFFFCDIPAASGGETPIGDNRLIFRKIDPEVVERFRQKKLCISAITGMVLVCLGRRFFKPMTKEKWRDTATAWVFNWNGNRGIGCALFK